MENMFDFVDPWDPKLLESYMRPLYDWSKD